MVEGHSVHRVAAQFTSKFVGRKWKAFSPNGRFRDGAKAINQKKFRAIKAVGKNLFAFFGKSDVVHVHFGMSGRWSIFNTEEAPETTPTTRLVLEGHGIRAHLSAMTVRHYRELGLYEAHRSKLGQDPLDPDADVDALEEKVLKSKKPISRLLMDQSFFAGVGNIYRAEILFCARQYPKTLGKDLTTEQFRRVWDESVRLMEIGRETGRIVGVTEADWAKYVDAKSKPDRRRWIYNQSQCAICNGRIVSYDENSRTVWACLQCQARPSNDSNSSEEECHDHMVTTPSRTTRTKRRKKGGVVIKTEDAAAATGSTTTMTARQRRQRRGVVNNTKKKKATIIIKKERKHGEKKRQKEKSSPLFYSHCAHEPLSQRRRYPAKLLVKELRSELVRLGYSSKGNKQDLVSRLTAHYEDMQEHTADIDTTTAVTAAMQGTPSRRGKKTVLNHGVHGYNRKIQPRRQGKLMKTSMSIEETSSEDEVNAAREQRNFKKITRITRKQSSFEDLEAIDSSLKVAAFCGAIKTVSNVLGTLQHEYKYHGLLLDFSDSTWGMALISAAEAGRTRVFKRISHFLIKVRQPLTEIQERKMKDVRLKRRGVGDINPLYFQDENGQNILHHADILLNALDQQGNTPLHLCASFVKSMHFVSPRRDSINTTLFMDAFSNYNRSYSDDVEGENDTSEDGLNMLDEDITRHEYEPNDELLSTMLEYSKDINAVNKNGQTPLHILAVAGNASGMQLYLNEVTVRNNDGLGKKDMKEILQHQDKSGNTALHYAVLSDRSPPQFDEHRDDDICTRTILNTNAFDKSCSNTKKQTPLHYASFIGSYRVVDLLLSAGFDAGATDIHGRTAMHLAASNGHDKVLRIISLRYDESTEGSLDQNVAFKELVNHTDNYGRSCVHYAAMRSSSRKLLKKYKKRYNSEYDTASPIRFLLSLGLQTVNVIAKDFSGLIPFDYAKNEEIQALLYDCLPTESQTSRPRVRSRAGSVISYKTKKEKDCTKFRRGSIDNVFMDVEEDGQGTTSIAESTNQKSLRVQLHGKEI
eukprot:g1618.t1